MSDQYDLLNPDKSIDEAQITAAIELLEKNHYKIVKTKEDARTVAIEAGYKVIEPILINERIITLLDLRNYFFMRLWKKYPDRQKYYVHAALNRELHVFRLMVEAREKTGLNRFNAVQECVAIVDVIFDHEEEFGFKNPIDLNVLGQAKAGWITQKALAILNSKLRAGLDQAVDKLIETRDKERKIDLRAKSLELDELLKKMEANNG